MKEQEAEMNTMKRSLRRSVSVLLIALLALGLLIPLTGKAANTKEPQSSRTREISIVYDDSGSMYNSVTSWSQAKYALQVFTAMMGEHDTLNIYELSKEGKKPVRLEGRNDKQSNVNVVDAMDGVYSDTPIGPVQAAGDALMRSAADDKWLIIITDGWFSHTTDPANDILKYVGENGVKVVYIAIGEAGSVLDLTPYAREGFYPFRTDEYSILETMTTAATLVFNYKPVPISGVGSGTITFHADIPLAKLVIFAQGKNVTIEELQLDGKPLQPGKEEKVRVKTDYASGGANYGPLAPNLNGIIYTAEPEKRDTPFPEGSYSFSCSVENVQVFAEAGVDVETVLIGESGETLSVDAGGLKEIPEGNWRVEVHLVNPLNGKVIQPAEDSLIAGYALSLYVSDDQGNTKTYASGDTITVEGKAIQIYGKAVFPGMTESIERISPLRSLKVVKGKLYLSFDAPGGYELDAVMLQTDRPIRFSITLNGKPLTASQSENVKFTVKSTAGIAWSVRQTDDSGHYEITPAYDKRSGLKAVTPGEVDLNVTAKLNDKGDHRDGEGSVRVRISTESRVGLDLKLTMPQETVPADRGSGAYMFDCQQLGLPTGEAGDEERPYILVTVLATSAEGVSRKLTEEEWDQGVDNFSFTAAERYPSFLWKLAEWFVMGQGLNFTAVKGPELSTYKLYLAPPLLPFSRNVLPNTSDLTVTLTYRFENGASLSGSAEGAVTVKPLPLWMYLVWLIAILAVLLLIAAVVIRELTKPRFAKGFRPQVTVSHSANGAPSPIAPGSYVAKYKKKYRLSLTKPEECYIRVHDNVVPQTGLTVSFTIVAVDRYGAFRLKSIAPFGRVNGSVVFGSQTLDQLRTDNAWRNTVFQPFLTTISLSCKSGQHEFNKDITL